MLHLLPYPRHLHMGKGAFLLTPDACIVLQGTNDALARTAASQLQAEIAADCVLTLDIRCGTARAGDICLQEKHAADAGYVLLINPEGACVTGCDAEGLLHGVQTLRQIVRQSGWMLPELIVEDAPVFRARGFYHDVTRGRVPTLDWLRHLADQACFYKLNQLQLYVEHSYLFRDVTELWRIGTPLTAEDIMALDDYCAARGVELVPSLSSFGHLLELLRSKSFCHLCEMEGSDQMPSTMPHRMEHHTVNVSDPAAFEQIAAMIDEYMALFRSRKFNICADETYDLGKGRSADIMAEVGERAHYIGFVKKLCGHVVSRGCQPMFWGDIVVRFADALSELPQGTICLNWGYSASESEDNTCILAQAGATQYVCPGVNGWNQWMPRLGASYENISRMAAYGRKWHAVGLLNTDWGDYGHINDPRFSLPGMIYGACAAWSGGLPPFEAINESISRLAYLDRSGKCVGHLNDLDGCAVYKWWFIVRHKDWAQGMLVGAPSQPPLQQVGDSYQSAGTAVQAARERLDAAAAGLRACCIHMDASARPMLMRWQLAAEAIGLWNETAHAVREGRKDAALAVRMERWLHRYEKQWRTVSQESELWRIRDVAAWYVDQLR